MHEDQLVDPDLRPRDYNSCRTVLLIGSNLNYNEDCLHLLSATRISDLLGLVLCNLRRNILQEGFKRCPTISTLNPVVLSWVLDKRLTFLLGSTFSRLTARMYTGNSEIRD